MVKGSVETLMESDMKHEEVMDLIPFYPLSQHHETIIKIYRDNLTKLYEELT